MSAKYCSTCGAKVILRDSSPQYKSIEEYRNNLNSSDLRVFTYLESGIMNPQEIAVQTGLPLYVVRGAVQRMTNNELVLEWLSGRKPKDIKAYQQAVFGWLVLFSMSIGGVITGILLLITSNFAPWVALIISSTVAVVMAELRIRKIKRNYKHATRLETRRD
jgi:hypothetical protein